MHYWPTFGPHLPLWLFECHTRSYYIKGTTLSWKRPNCSSGFPQWSAAVWDDRRVQANTELITRHSYEQANYICTTWPRESFCYWALWQTRPEDITSIDCSQCANHILWLNQPPPLLLKPQMQLRHSGHSWPTKDTWSMLTASHQAGWFGVLWVG